MPSKLARSLPLTIRRQPTGIETPLLVPSFSSKDLLDIAPVFEALIPSITESFLISDYDVAHGLIKPPLSPVAEILFLDSGGYEVSKDYDIMDPLYPVPESKEWNVEKYLEVLTSFEPTMPTIVTFFYHPNVYRDIPVQIESALNVFGKFPQFGRELLIKPETKDQSLLPINGITARVGDFKEFDVIGMTEAELGYTLFDRMNNIARIRIAMDGENVATPLHIFGSLDPVCTPLYFISGADIFDGLTWLRFSYMDDVAVYHRNRVPLQFGAKERDYEALARSYTENLYYLADLTGRMNRYLLDGDEDRFGRHSKFYKQCIDDLRFRRKGAI